MRLDGIASVRPTSDLVADGTLAPPGAALAARLAEVVVLPQLGEAVYWREPGRFGQPYHGQHGGLSPEETEIPLVAWPAE